MMAHQRQMYETSGRNGPSPARLGSIKDMGRRPKAVGRSPGERMTIGGKARYLESLKRDEKPKAKVSRPRASMTITKVGGRHV